MLSIAEVIIKTDLYVKPTDSHQYLLSNSCNPFYSEKVIPYSQTLRLNRMHLSDKFFNKRCNDLEEYQLDRGYSERMVRKEILRAKKTTIIKKTTIK